MFKFTETRHGRVRLTNKAAFTIIGVLLVLALIVELLPFGG